MRELQKKLEILEGGRTNLSPLASGSAGGVGLRGAAGRNWVRYLSHMIECSASQ